MAAQTTTPTKTSTLNRDGIKRIITVFSIVFLYGVLLFASAGRLDWSWAWFILASTLLY